MTSYPTIPGKFEWQVIGDCSMGVCSMGVDFTATEEEARSYFDREVEAWSATPGWSNVRLERGRAVVDADAMRKIAADLSQETGADVGYSYHGGLTVRFGNTVETSVEPTAEAVRAAVEQQRAIIWNQPDRSVGSTGGSWFDERD